MKYLLLLSLIPAFFFSCKTPAGARRTDISNKSVESLLAEQKKTNLDFTWLSARIAADVTTPDRSVSFKINLRIRKDSLIWMSISPALGIEAVRALIRPDSVFIMNRVNNTVLETDFNYLSDIASTDIDFGILQSLITASAIDDFDATEFQAFPDKEGYLLSRLKKRKMKRVMSLFERIERLEKKEKPERIERLEDRRLERIEDLSEVSDSSQFIAQSVWLNPADYRITRYRFRGFEPDRILEVDYNSFTEEDGLTFPREIKVQATGEAPMNAELNFTRISTGEEISFPFSIPASYKRTRLE